MKIEQAIPVSRRAPQVVPLVLTDVGNCLYHVVARGRRAGRVATRRVGGRTKSAHVVAINYKHAAIFSAANQFMRMRGSVVWQNQRPPPSHTPPILTHKCPFPTAK